MYHRLPSLILGFHGCDKKVGLDILNGKTHFNPSSNSWDWLGDGIYFWEQNPMLALEYATNIAEGKQKANTKIETPFVIGAILDLGNCLNLTEYNSLQFIKEGYKGLKETIEKAGEKMPVNKGNNKALDYAVIKYIHASNHLEKIQPYDSVRGAYFEGNSLYEGTEFKEKNHIQIAIRDNKSILGTFLPLPIHLYNPRLKSK